MFHFFRCPFSNSGFHPTWSGKLTSPVSVSTISLLNFCQTDEKTWTLERNFYPTRVWCGFFFLRSVRVLRRKTECRFYWMVSVVPPRTPSASGLLIFFGRDQRRRVSLARPAGRHSVGDGRNRFFAIDPEMTPLGVGGRSIGARRPKHRFTRFFNADDTTRVFAQYQLAISVSIFIFLPGRRNMSPASEMITRDKKIW